MKSRWNSLVVGGCNVFGLALLALSAMAGGSAVHAGDPSALESFAIEPLTKLVSGIEERVANLEASMATFANAFTAKRITAQELCVADDNGAQTCISKAQLDALLKSVIQTGQAPGATGSDLAGHAACTETCVAPAAEVAAVAPPEAPPATEPSVSEAPPPIEPSVAAVEDPAAPEGVIATPPATPVTAGETAAADSEASSLLPAEESIPLPPTKAAETVVATAVTPETLVPAGPAVQDEKSGQGDATDTSPAAPDVDAAPAEAPGDQ